MKSSNFIVAIIVLLLVKFVIIGITLGGIGSQHDSGSVDSSITSLESSNFQWAWSSVLEDLGFLNSAYMSLKNYFVFGSCGVDWYLSVGNVQTQTMRMSIQYDPCLARQKVTYEASYFADDDQSKQGREIEADVEGFEDSDFCKKSGKACASAGAASGALYGIAFAFAFINLVVHLMRFFQEDNMTKCYIAGGIELLTGILMAVGTSSFASGCTKLAMKDLDDYYTSLIAALTAGDKHLNNDDYFTDDVVKHNHDLSSDFSEYNGIYATCGIIAACISFILISCVVCSRPVEDVPPVQKINGGVEMNKVPTEEGPTEVAPTEVVPTEA